MIALVIIETFFARDVFSYVDWVPETTDGADSKNIVASLSLILRSINQSFVDL